MTSNGKEVAVEFTRPANTTAYAVGDVISNNATTTVPVEIASIANDDGKDAGGSGFIVGVKLTTNKKQCDAQVRVHFYKATLATLGGDNVAMIQLYANDSNYIGYVDLPAMGTPADTTNSDASRSQNHDVRIRFKATTRNSAGLYSIWATLEALSIFTPALAQKFTLTIYGEVD